MGEGPAGGTDLAAAGRASTRWGQEDDTAAGTAGAGVRPCQGAALAEVEEGGWCSSEVEVSGRSGSLWQVRGWAGRCEGRCTLLTRDDGERARVTAHSCTAGLHLSCTYMRGRRRIGAVGRLLARRRLPVRRHLALATLVIHGGCWMLVWSKGAWKRG